jgi:peptidoglycan-N-acetylmuramic acid deacetylase
MVRIHRRMRMWLTLCALACCAVLITLAAVGIFTPTVPVFAKPTVTVEYDWYYQPRTDGQQPLPCPEPNFLKKYNNYYLGSPVQKVIYLTFDAGYENGYMPSILDTLKKHHAPAAFFLTGHYLKTQPDLIKRMVAEGHLVCNHSNHHPDMAALTDFEKFKKELTDVEDMYRDITGQEMPKYFRPPQGKFSETVLKYAQELGYTTIFWSFAYRDWLVDDQPQATPAISLIMQRTHPGEIALLHATSKTNADILDDVLTRWESEGYQIRSLDDLVDNYDLQSDTDLLMPHPDMLDLLP